MDSVKSVFWLISVLAHVFAKSEKSLSSWVEVKLKKLEPLQKVYICTNAVFFITQRPLSWVTVEVQLGDLPPGIVHKVWY